LGHLYLDIVSNFELRISDFASLGISTLVERSLQIHPFLTNKANFRKSQMNVSNVLTMNYDKMDTWSSGKNKANSKPIQTQFKANSNPIQSQFKPNSKPIQTQFKPNTNPIQTQYKPNTNPIQTQNERNLFFKRNYEL